ncbi:MAG: 6,7-dimethyl-8-ribityllumazine synthase [Actinobacteria bacterium]|nr:6,7-dimethyl-8-ribityllumazine synthase [Actinomycetota bacterium]
MSDADVTVAAMVVGFHREVAEALLDGARRRFVDCGLAAERIAEHWVPGALELPLACEVAAASGRYAALVVLGAVVRGETPNFDHVCGTAIQGIGGVSVARGIPIGFGLLTVDTMEQATARAGGTVGNAGIDAADAAVHMLNLVAELRPGPR